MQFETDDAGEARMRARLIGRLDAPGADRIGLPFTATVVSAGKHVMLDLSRVEFVSSLGIRLLLSVARAVKQKGRVLVLFGAQGQVLEVLETAAVPSLVPFAADEAAAQALLPA